MAKIYTAPFAQTPKTKADVATAALGGLGTSTVTGAILLVTAGSDGAVVTKITATPRATVTASALSLFLVKSAAPTIYMPIDSELMLAYTAAVTTAAPETNFANISPDSPMRLEAGDKIYVGTQVALAAGIAFYAEWMDY